MSDPNHLFDRYAHVLDSRRRRVSEAERARAEAALLAALDRGERMQFKKLRAVAEAAGLRHAARRALQDLGYRQVMSSQAGPEYTHQLPVALAEGVVVVTAYVPVLLTSLFLGAWNLAPYRSPARGVALAPVEARLFELTGHDGRDLVWSARGSGPRPGVVRVVVRRRSQ